MREEFQEDLAGSVAVATGCFGERHETGHPLATVATAVPECEFTQHH
jgi:hypothetical protein